MMTNGRNQMDPHSLDDLAEYAKAMAIAITAKDREQMEQIAKAIREVFDSPDTTEGAEADEILREMESSTAGKEAVESVAKEDAAFMSRYIRAKSEAGLRTQRAVAEACGVSKNTINAIETEETIPQFGTLEKIAKGLNVKVHWLMTGED